MCVYLHDIHVFACTRESPGGRRLKDGEVGRVRVRERGKGGKEAWEENGEEEEGWEGREEERKEVKQGRQRPHMRESERKSITCERE